MTRIGIMAVDPGVKSGIAAGVFTLEVASTWQALKWGDATWSKTIDSREAMEKEGWGGSVDGGHRRLRLAERGCRDRFSVGAVEEGVGSDSRWPRVHGG